MDWIGLVIRKESAFAGVVIGEKEGIRIRGEVVI